MRKKEKEKGPFFVAWLLESYNDSFGCYYCKNPPDDSRPYYNKIHWEILSQKHGRHLVWRRNTHALTLVISHG